MIRERIAQFTDSIAASVASTGFAITHNAFDAGLVGALADDAREAWADQEFHAAKIGTGEQRRLAPAIRSDYICWLDQATATPAQQELMGELDLVRSAINRATMLGLFEWEGHLACYPPGGHYHRHLDVFANARQRQVSTVLYLNRNWRDGDGGELRLWTEPAKPNWSPASPYIDIPPRAGTLVTFLSEEMFHEVRPAHTDRFSLTGWFRTRG